MKKLFILLLMITSCSMVFAEDFTDRMLREQRESFNRTVEYNQMVNQNQRLYEIKQQMEQQNSYRPTYYSNDSYQRPTYVQDKPLYKFGSSSEL